MDQNGCDLHLLEISSSVSGSSSEDECDTSSNGAEGQIFIINVVDKSHVKHMLRPTHF